MHEEVWRGRIGEALSHFEENPPRGEFTLVIEGAEEEVWDDGRVREELVEMLKEGITKREAVKIVAEISGWPKREVYKLALSVFFNQSQVNRRYNGLVKGTTD
jgi:16S rRNA (cytidine1402-2'-O)-methyltransferase